MSVVAPIDSPAAAVTGSIAAGPLPQGVAVVGNRLYVVNQSGTVTVIDVTTNTVVDLNPATPAIDRIAAGSAPFATAVQSNRLYVANINDDSVTIIDTTTNTVNDANARHPRHRRLHHRRQPSIRRGRPRQPSYYVANQNDNTVTVIDTTNNAVVDANLATPAIDPITVPNPYAVAASGNRLYVTNVFDDTVTVIDTTTNTVVDANPATPAIDPITVGDGAGRDRGQRRPPLCRQRQHQHRHCHRHHHKHSSCDAQRRQLANGDSGQWQPRLRRLPKLRRVGDRDRTIGPPVASAAVSTIS